MAVVEIAKIQVRRGQENITGVPRLDPGEFGWAQDTENLYIGKRIAEGASDDENTRILTEQDLDNIFALLNVVNTLTIVSPYQYRTDVPYIASDTVVRFGQRKLDETVSLEDFGILPSIIPVDITAQFQNAVETIFKNDTWSSNQRQDARRRLKVPAGNYFISAAISLPPYTTLIGEGPELTKLQLTSNTTNIFRTVDADGNDYSTNDMRSGVKRARQVHIEGMTLEYGITSGSNNGLISLDNVLDATVKNCVLRTTIDPISTTTFGLVAAGVGITVRGTGGGLGSGDTNLCENIYIDDCTFDSLYVGVQSTGTVIRPSISDSRFSNLNRGIELYTVDSLPGPINGIIDKNRFENIVQEGIYVGPNPGDYRSEHIVSHNFFVQVGNGVNLDDFITTSTGNSSVITFDAPGNKAVDNFFYREYVANSTTSTEFYYFPLIKGKLLTYNSAVTTSTVAAGETAEVFKIPITGKDQLINVNYQMVNDRISRKGNLIINVVAIDYTASISDIFNFSELQEENTIPEEVYFSPGYGGVNNNYITIECNNVTTNELFISYQYDIMT